MDKVKQAIAKELANECYKNSSCFDEKGKQVNCLKDCAYVKNLSSSLASLIIKWLEEHRVMYGEFDGARRNQLITELIGELR
jgi:hypothetical protein